MIPIYQIKRDADMRLKLIKYGPAIKTGQELLTLMDETTTHSLMCDSHLALHAEHTEYMYALCLDKSLNFKAIVLCAAGTENTVPTSINNIMASLILTGCQNLIVVHNHPSGIDEPSTQDIAWTKQIANACKQMNFGFIDHYIVATHDKGYSFAVKKSSALRHHLIEKPY